MAPADFTYAGGSENYSVTSYAAVSRPGDATRTVPVAWTAEFVEDDGSGGYNVIRPSGMAHSFYRERQRRYVGHVVLGYDCGSNGCHFQFA